MATQSDIAKRSGTEAARVERTRSGRNYLPDVDIIERDDELTVLADMPGTRSEGIDIHFERGMLTIHAKVEDRQPAGTRFLLREYATGDYWRSFEVSEAVNASGITAEYADGVLTLHLPKAEAAKPRKIAVRGS